MLEVIDVEGNSTIAEFDCKYHLPTEILKDDDVLTMKAYLEWRGATDRSDQDKRRRLQNKIVINSDTKYQAGRTLRFWTCFVPNRGVWEKLSEFNGVADTQEEGIEEKTDAEASVSYLFTSGLFTSSKGMPTGISVEIKPRGSAGYFPNFFIMIEDPSLSFDIGRKAIQGRQQGMLREIAYEQFRDYIREISSYVSGAIDDPDPIYDRDEAFEVIRELPDLDSDLTRFIKRPNGQEATVAALFFEQLGRGAFAGFSPLISGYKERYDLYGRSGKKGVVTEFKFDLQSLFRDFSDARKMFDEIDVVVIWDVTESDRKFISAKGLMLTDYSLSSLGQVKRLFEESSYRLDLQNVRPIEVICMRKLLKPME